MRWHALLCALTGQSPTPRRLPESPALAIANEVVWTTQRCSWGGWKGPGFPRSLALQLKSYEQRNSISPFGRMKVPLQAPPRPEADLLGLVFLSPPLSPGCLPCCRHRRDSLTLSLKLPRRRSGKPIGYQPGHTGRLILACANCKLLARSVKTGR